MTSSPRVSENTNAMRLSLEDLRGPECVWCGKELDPATRQTTYCCDAHNNAHRAHMDRQERLTEKASWDRKCPVCEAPIPVEAKADKIYCSVRCRQSVLIYRHRGAPRLAARANRTCENCGNKFTLSKSNARYCSRRCQQGAWQKRKRARK